MSRRNNDLENQEDLQKPVNKVSKNKALALSFAVALAVSNIGLTPDTHAANAMNNRMVLEKEQEGTEADREWQEEDEQGYSNYNPGGGYYYRPWIYTGSSSTRSTAWVSSGTKKTSSVGGYHISKGSAAG